MLGGGMKEERGKIRERKSVSKVGGGGDRFMVKSIFQIFY